MRPPWNRRSWCALAALALLAAPAAAGAGAVVPSDRVTSRVVVRDAPGSEGRDVGGLRPGERAALVEPGTAWHRVRHEGRLGWVSAAWTRVVRGAAGGDALEFEPEATLAARLERASRTPPEGDGLWDRVASLWRPSGRVTFRLESPALDSVERRHFDPVLPVSGLAHAAGASGRFDVVLALDVSASTNDPAGADVDGDGVVDERWKGPDSILAAQVRAAAGWLEAVRRLPGNRDGRRIRVGLVTYSGDDAHHRSAQDAARPLDAADLRALARRDAELRVPPTRDYDAVRDALDAVARAPGRGMTDFAAGLVRATEALVGAGRPDVAAAPGRTERVIYFLTDGKPRLPHDREKAERAARRAADQAARHGVRVHVFALGRNAVTGRLNDTAHRIAAKTGGTCTEIDDPADVVPLLRAARFSFVDRVRMVNRTTDDDVETVGTGIDGSFYGEVPLVEGRNEIDLVAELYGGGRETHRLRVAFHRVPREQRLAEELEAIRRENAALLQRIQRRQARKLKLQLVREMERVRAEGRPAKELEVEVQRGPAAPAP